MDYECICGKVTKSARGLTLHKKSCKVFKDSLDVVEDAKVVEVTNELSEDVKRQIDKLMDARNCCYDAKAKYELEYRIVELGGKLR